MSQTTTLQCYQSYTTACLLIDLFKISELGTAMNQSQSRRGGPVGIGVIPLEIWESNECFGYLLQLCNKGLIEHSTPSQWSKSEPI